MASRRSYHSDIREIGDQRLGDFKPSDQIFKQHIPPTERNLRTLRTVKKVILLREPREIVDAYYRAEEGRMHSPRPELEGCQTLHDRHETAERNGLSEDLECFYGGWGEEARKTPEMSLIVHYSALVGSPTETVNPIEEFFGLASSQSVVLSKERYSRGPQFRHLLRQIMRRAGHYLRWMSR